MISGCAVSAAEVIPPPSDLSTEQPLRLLPGLPSSEPVSTPRVLLDPELVAEQLGKVSTKSLKTTGYAVFNSDGTQLALKNDKPMVPASTMKVLTSMAAIDVLGASTRFNTKVVSNVNGQITLVGGGDPFLQIKKSKVAAKRANLDALVKATAKSLKAKKIKTVTLSYDASLFAGASYSSSWKKSWSSYTARIKSLVVNSGKSTGWRADADPAKATAKVFAKGLRKKGIKVKKVKAGKALPEAPLLAQVESATVGTIVRETLLYSDNVAAEILARHVAIARGYSPTFGGASLALTQWLNEHELWVAGMKIDGGSGLTNKAKIAPSVLAKAMGVVLKDAKYLDVAWGLPVAGESGTLKKRFNDKQEKAGRKVVHAKTGSLKAVDSLAGYVKTVDGSVLTFAFMVAHDGNKSTAAMNWIDRSATVLATCGCS